MQKINVLFVMLISIYVFRPHEDLNPENWDSLFEEMRKEKVMQQQQDERKSRAREIRNKAEKQQRR